MDPSPVSPNTSIQTGQDSRPSSGLLQDLKLGEIHIPPPIDCPLANLHHQVPQNAPLTPTSSYQTLTLPPSPGFTPKQLQHSINLNDNSQWYSNSGHDIQNTILQQHSFQPTLSSNMNNIQHQPIIDHNAHNQTFLSQSNLNTNQQQQQQQYQQQQLHQQQLQFQQQLQQQQQRGILTLPKTRQSNEQQQQQQVPISGGQRRSRHDDNIVESGDDDNDDEQNDTTTISTRRTSTRTTKATTTRSTRTSSRSKNNMTYNESDDESQSNDDSDEEDDDMIPATRKKGANTRRKGGTTTKAGDEDLDRKEKLAKKAERARILRRQRLDRLDTLEKENHMQKTQLVEYELVIANHKQFIQQFHYRNTFLIQLLDLYKEKYGEISDTEQQNIINSIDMNHAIAKPVQLPLISQMTTPLPQPMQQQQLQHQSQPLQQQLVQHSSSQSSNQFQPTTMTDIQAATTLIGDTPISMNSNMTPTITNMGNLSPDFNPNSQSLQSFAALSLDQQPQQSQQQHQQTLHTNTTTTSTTSTTMTNNINQPPLDFSLLSQSSNNNMLNVNNINVANISLLNHTLPQTTSTTTTSLPQVLNHQSLLKKEPPHLNCPAGEKIRLTAELDILHVLREQLTGTAQNLLNAIAIVNDGITKHNVDKHMELLAQQHYQQQQQQQQSKDQQQ